MANFITKKVYSSIDEIRYVYDNKMINIHI